MPFNHFVPHAFTATSIRAHAPQACGVIGLSNARDWILIETSDDIRHSLLELLKDSNLSRYDPAGFVFEICGNQASAGRRDALVTEYAPLYATRRPRR